MFVPSKGNSNSGETGICPICRAEGIIHPAHPATTRHRCDGCTTGGTANAHYWCPIVCRPVVLGVDGIALDHPCKLVFLSGADHKGGYRLLPTPAEHDALARAHSRVFGLGCVVHRDYLPARRGLAGLHLATVAYPGDPRDWLINHPLTIPVHDTDHVWWARISRGHGGGEIQ
ncbi:hypothetical protein [Nocardia arthritidis]|uniref:hypothetical protein n=1 Tax=Nocardia arthritidis TaxID=228602 RepID=UPI00142E4AC5|nr:hypothetical protein [Nocardia arthritidis]